jgi:hypothetical protein
VLRQSSVNGLPPAALPGAKLLKKFDQNFLLPFGRLLYRYFHLDTAPGADLDYNLDDFCRQPEATKTIYLPFSFMFLQG